MSLNPDDYLFSFDMMAKELDEVDDGYDIVTQRIAERQKKRDEEKQIKTEELQQQISNAMKSSAYVRKTLDMDYEKQLKRRETERVLRREREKEAADDREIAWKEQLKREVESRELRQQHLDRDSAREKADRLDRFNTFENMLEARKLYHDRVTHNGMILANSQRQLAEAKVQVNKYFKEGNQLKLDRAQIKYSDNKAITDRPNSGGHYF